MKNKIFKILSCIFAVFMLCGIAGCGQKGDEDMNDNGGQKVVLPNYDEVKAEQFIINAWYAPELTLEAYREYRDCGFNYVFLMGDKVGSIGSARMEQALTYCDQVGLKAFVDVSRALNTIDAVIADYVKHPSFVGFNYDEPVIYRNTLNKADGLVDIGPVVEKMHGKYPQVEFLVNLNPTTSMSFAWGTPSFTYDEYLEAQEKHVNSVYADSSAKNWLSCDAYPLCYDNGAKNPYYLRTTWLANLEYLANAKRDSEYKLTTNFFIQTMPFAKKNNRVPTYEDIRLQTYALLAYGYDSVSHFCYQTPPVGDEFSDTQLALIDREGKQTDIYAAAKKVNTEILKLQNTYMQFNSQWLGVCPILGANNIAQDEDYFNISFDGLSEPLTVSRLAGVQSVTSTEDIIIGYMKDKAGNAGFMVVNYNDTKAQKKANTAITFKSFTKADVYRGGEKTTVNLTDGKLDLQLDVGEGVFVIPHG